MTIRARMVALRDDAGKIEVHANGAMGVGDYTTLCGVDSESSYSSAPVEKGARINCSQCAALWRAWGQFKARDFSSENR